MEEVKVFDIVHHFKHETLTEEQKKAGLYTYRIVSLDAVHTETGEHLVIYKALYDGRPYGIDVVPDQVFARPAEMFFSEVDHNTQISNRNTDLKSLIRSQGTNPLAFLFPDTFYILRISDKF